MKRIFTGLLGQWLNFKLFGITYLVGKIKCKLFFPGPLGVSWEHLENSKAAVTAHEPLWLT